jgi:hypothetical protein
MFSTSITDFILILDIVHMNQLKIVSGSVHGLHFSHLLDFYTFGNLIFFHRINHTSDYTLPYVLYLSYTSNIFNKKKSIQIIFRSSLSSSKILY